MFPSHLVSGKLSLAPAGYPQQEISNLALLLAGRGLGVIPDLSYSLWILEQNLISLEVSFVNCKTGTGWVRRHNAELGVKRKHLI